MCNALLAIDAVAMFGIGCTQSSHAIMVMLAMDGLAYGGFVVAGQTYISNRTTASNRGATGAVYGMASGIGGTVGPFLLSVVADRWGLRFVFAAVGATLALGAMAFAAGFVVLRTGRMASSTSQAEVQLAQD